MHKMQKTTSGTQTNELNQALDHAGVTLQGKYKIRTMQETKKGKQMSS